MIFWLDDRISETTKKNQEVVCYMSVLDFLLNTPRDMRICMRVCMRTKSPTEIIHPGFAENDGSRFRLLAEISANIIVGRKVPRSFIEFQDPVHKFRFIDIEDNSYL